MIRLSISISPLKAINDVTQKPQQTHKEQRQKSDKLIKICKAKFKRRLGTELRRYLLQKDIKFSNLPRSHKKEEIPKSHNPERTVSNSEFIICLFCTASQTVGSQTSFRERGRGREKRQKQWRDRKGKKKKKRKILLILALVLTSQCSSLVLRCSREWGCSVERERERKRGRVRREGYLLSQKKLDHFLKSDLSLMILRLQCSSSSSIFESFPPRSKLWRARRRWL